MPAKRRRPDSRGAKAAEGVPNLGAVLISRGGGKEWGRAVGDGRVAQATVGRQPVNVRRAAGMGEDRLWTGGSVLL